MGRFQCSGKVLTILPGSFLCNGNVSLTKVHFFIQNSCTSCIFEPNPCKIVLCSHDCDGEMNKNE
jgi:hypothetical protein